MIGNDIVNSFDVVGFNSNGREHETVCKEACKGMTLWVQMAKSRHLVHP